MGTLPTTAMIFAAGEGTRMRPITNTIPKPLVKVGGKTLLDHNIDLVAKAGINNVVVNSSYLADQIKTHVEHRLNHQPVPHITTLYEPERLETGGGIINALPHLGNKPFFCLNSDVILIDAPNISSLKAMADFWDSERMVALLLLYPLDMAIGYDGKGNFLLDKDGKLMMASEGENPPYVFTGTQILCPSLFKGLPVSKFSLRDIYFKCAKDIAAGKGIYGLVHEGAWLHIGTPEGVDLADNFLRKCPIAKG